MYYGMDSSGLLVLHIYIVYMQSGCSCQLMAIIFTWYPVAKHGYLLVDVNASSTRLRLRFSQVFSLIRSKYTHSRGNDRLFIFVCAATMASNGINGVEPLPPRAA
ncbi:hypothetical protein FIBSPDRAFT_476798 [Athelia psychrophila]|uniref:Uncharacterized protein n=1 Tax=Athelia psychrophila TaxID=1759441 RepID=A0A167TZ35_9AGAM|nr:hypothetical protein FIBSPDRAFT_476798 [Fibularhizoctonia sp. CBS 109695]